MLDLDGTHLTGGSISIAETHPGTCGRYPGETGTEDESACAGTINGNGDVIWIREVNGKKLVVGEWVRAWLARNSPDGIPVYDTDEGLAPGTFSGARLFNSSATVYTDDGTGPVSTIAFSGSGTGIIFDTDNYAGGTADYLTVPEDGYYLVGCDFPDFQWIPLGGDSGSEQGFRLELFTTNVSQSGIPLTGFSKTLPTQTNDGHTINGGPYFEDGSCSSLFQVGAGDAFYLQLALDLGSGGTFEPGICYFWIQKVG